MRKNVLVLIVVAFTVFLTGCGSNKTTTDSVSGITTVPILSTDISGKTLYMKSSKNDFQLNTDNTVTFNGSRIGTWKLSIAGKIEITHTSGATSSIFTCIQKEPVPGYLLVFDTVTNEISRLYLDPANVINFDPTRMGGSIQGTPLTLTDPASISVSTFAGSTTGASGRVNAMGTLASFNRPMNITTDGINFYVADYTNNQIRKIDASGVVTLLAGSADGSIGSSDGTGTTATFNNPRGITTDGTTLYVTDSGNHTIRSVNKDTGEVETIAGFVGTIGSVDSTIGTSAGFNFPTGITTDGTNLYVADYGNHTIRKVIISSTLVSTIAGNVATIGSDDGISTKARFYFPSYITTDGSNLYVTDFSNRTIREIVISTGEVTTLAGIANTAPGAVDGTGPAAGFYNLGGITSDGVNLYVSDYSNAVENDKTPPTLEKPWISLIRKVVIATGKVTTLAGGPVTTRISSSVDGTGNNARFVTPIGITTDGRGLYLTDSTFNNIRLLN